MKPKQKIFLTPLAFFLFFQGAGTLHSHSDSNDSRHQDLCVFCEQAPSVFWKEPRIFAKEPADLKEKPSFEELLFPFFRKKLPPQFLSRPPPKPSLVILRV